MQKINANQIQSQLIITAQTGTILSTTGRHALVSVHCGNNDACGGCAVSAICRPSQKEMTIEALLPNWLAASDGDKVTLEADAKGWWSGWMLLGAIPCLLTIAGVAIGTAAHWSEIATAATPLAALGIYFSILRLLRPRIGRRVVWRITGIVDRA